MGGEFLNNYAQFIGKEIPSNMARRHDYFNIEMSIVMRKPKGHYSRAPGMIWKILNDFNGGTFFQGQGYWQGWQEPVIYLMISTEGEVGKILKKLELCLEEAQNRLKQQMMFVKINGSVYIGSMLDDESIKAFPNQMEFDDDLAKLSANQSRIGENYQLIFARVFRQEGILFEAEESQEKALESYKKSYDIYTQLEAELLEAPENSNTNIDLLKCYSNVLAPQTRRFMSEDEIRKTFDTLIRLLPLNRPSDYSGAMSGHAEARIRGNRLILFSQLTDNLDYSGEEFVLDGIFAIRQLVSFLNPDSDNRPYLDNDPLVDIKMVMKYIAKISPDFDLGNKLKDDFEQLLSWFPEYSFDISSIFEK